MSVARMGLHGLSDEHVVIISARTRLHKPQEFLQDSPIGMEQQPAVGQAEFLGPRLTFQYELGINRISNFHTAFILVLIPDPLGI